MNNITTVTTIIIIDTIAITQNALFFIIIFRINSPNHQVDDAHILSPEHFIGHWTLSFQRHIVSLPR